VSQDLETTVLEVRAPFGGLTLGEAGARVRATNGGRTIELTVGFPCDGFVDELNARVREAASADEVVVRTEIGSHAVPPQVQRLAQVRNIIAVASAKGGVGKSTVAANLAVGLAMDGAATGILDADIYGPSIPTMMGVKDQPGVVGQKILPMIAHDIKMMSFGFLIPEDQSVTWRGPMVHQAVQQLLRDVLWGELDCLVIDMPPGTGDAHLTLTQSVPLTGGLVVTTPQDVALIDARRGVAMFQQVNVPILGIIENMSYFNCPHCGDRTDIFTTGGGKRASEALGVPFVGELPIDPAVCLAGDQGTPIVRREPDSPQTEAFRQVANTLRESIGV
jgi:ATP-binding protein involved in chromosome partitioning